MGQSSGRDRHARRPALEPCEDRILLSIAVQPVGASTTQQPVAAYAPGNSPIVASQNATPDHASRVFDDPFFFDAN